MSLRPRYKIKDKTHGWYGFRIEKADNLPTTHPLGKGYSLYRVIDPGHHFNAGWVQPMADDRFEEIYPEIGWRINEYDNVPEQAYKGEYIRESKFMTFKEAKAKCMEHHMKIYSKIAEMEENENNNK